MANKAHFTILSGPPRSGKTRYTNELQNDPDQKVFMKFEGHNEAVTIDQIMRVLDDGLDVMYETTYPVAQISQRLLDRVDTIEIFRIN